LTLLNLELRSILLGFKLQILHLALQLSLLKLSVSLNLSHLRLRLSHFSFSQLVLRINKRLLLSTFLWCLVITGFIDEIIDKAIKLTTNTIRTKDKVKHTTSKSGTSGPHLSQALQSLRSSSECGQELIAAGFFLNFVSQNSAVGCNLKRKTARFIIAQQVKYILNRNL